MGGERSRAGTAFGEGGSNPRSSKARLLTIECQETNLITAWIQESPLEAYDIISDEKSIMSLCLLYSSMVGNPEI